MGHRRARDDSFHRNSSGASNSTVTSAGSNVVPRKPRRRRANTTNTFFLSSTMQKPVVKDTMVCVVAVVHGHMVAAAQAAPGGRTFDPRYAVFDDTTQGGSGERAHARVTPAHVRVPEGLPVRVHVKLAPAAGLGDDQVPPDGRQPRRRGRGGRVPDQRRAVAG